MKNFLSISFFLLPVMLFSQSKTTKEFSEKHENAFTLFFYKNTLRMLNQADNEEFELLVKDIDKMKVVRVDKSENNISDQDFKSLVAAYHQEDFEDLMTIRQEGMNVNVYIQEDKGVTTGLVLLMSDNESLSIVDIKGTVPLNKLANLISKIQNIEGFQPD